MDPKSLQSAAAARGSNYYLTGLPEGPMPLVFEAGLPDPTTFPAAELGRLLTEVLEVEAAELQYGSPIDGDLGYGNIGLRRLLAQRTLEIDGRPVDPAGVMLTSGGVQGIAEAIAAFLDPGDHAVVEAPTWDYTLRAIQATGAEATAIPLDDDGMQIDILEQHIARLEAAGERLKLVYTIATFNVPTAISLSEERRRRLVALAQEHGFVIVEDNVYADLRYDGDALPSLYSLDDAGLVVKVDSFSKTLMPALRLGWVTGDPAAIDALARVRRDLGVSQLVARAIARFVHQGRYEPHIASACDALPRQARRRRDRARTALHRHDDVEPPGRGLFLLARTRRRCRRQGRADAPRSRKASCAGPANASTANPSTASNACGLRSRWHPSPISSAPWRSSARLRRRTAASRVS